MSDCMPFIALLAARWPPERCEWFFQTIFSEDTNSCFGKWFEQWILSVNDLYSSWGTLFRYAMNRLINLSGEELGWKKEFMVEISYFDRVNEKIEYVWNPENQLVGVPLNAVVQLWGFKTKVPKIVGATASKPFLFRNSALHFIVFPVINPFQSVSKYYKMMRFWKWLTFLVQNGIFMADILDQAIFIRKCVIKVLVNWLTVTAKTIIQNEFRWHIILALEHWAQCPSGELLYEIAEALWIWKLI